MCNYTTQLYKTCGHAISETIDTCAYQHDNYAECANLSTIQQLEDREGCCGKRGCVRNNIKAAGATDEGDQGSESEDEKTVKTEIEV